MGPLRPPVSVRSPRCVRPGNPPAMRKPKLGLLGLVARVRNRRSARFFAGALTLLIKFKSMRNVRKS